MPQKSRETRLIRLQIDGMAALGQSCPWQAFGWLEFFNKTYRPDIEAAAPCLARPQWRAIFHEQDFTCLFLAI